MLSSFSRLFSATLLKNWGLSKSCGKSLGLTGNCSATALQCQASHHQLHESGMQETVPLAEPWACAQGRDCCMLSNKVAAPIRQLSTRTAYHLMQQCLQDAH